MGDTAGLRERVKSIVIARARLVVSAEDVPDDASLVEGDLALDSLQLLEVVVGMESEWGFQLADDELDPTNFSSLASLVTMVVRKVGAERTE